MKKKLTDFWKWVLNNPKSTFVILVILIVLIIVIHEFSGTHEGPDWESTPFPVSKNLRKNLSSSWDSSKMESWPVTATLAMCSEISYLNPPEAKTKFKNLGFRHIEPINSGSMAGYVLAIGDVAVVVFRGSDDFADWMVNLKITTTQTKHGLAHKGFQNSYLTLKPKVLDALRRFKAKHIWATGHSLGGALAVLCAYDLAGNENLDIYGLMTFGQPMVADKTLATSIDEILPKKFVHFVNELDFVPRIPPGFLHSGNMVWFIDGKVRLSNPRPKMGTEKSSDPPPMNQDNFVPMTEIEFEKMKDLIREGQAIKKTKEGATVYEGNIPFLQDHLMNSYLAKIQGVSKLQEEAIGP